jgi:hypothetical protein
MHGNRQKTQSYFALILGTLLLVGLFAVAGNVIAKPESVGNAESGNHTLTDEIITSVISPSKDNTLYEDDFGSLSNGKGQHIFTGETLLYGARRAVVAFDVAGNVPFGATIVSATLDLHLSLYTVFSQ